MASEKMQAAVALSEPLIDKQLDEPPEYDDEDSLSTFGASSSDEDDEGTTPSNSKGLVPRLDREGVASIVAASALAAGGLAASAWAATAAWPSALVLLMGGICVLSAPTVVRRQFRIARGEAMRKSVTNIRKEIVALKEELDFLAHSVRGLQGEFQVLVGVARELQGVVTMQGRSLEEAVDLMKENEAILGQTKENLRRTFVSIVAKVILRSDEDGSTRIDYNELPMVVLRLQMELEPHGIQLDTEIFEALMREDDGDLSNMMRFCAEMLVEGDSNTNGGPCNDSVESELTFNLEAPHRETWEKKPLRGMTQMDRARMVTLDHDRVCKGSVEAARGERVTLMPKKGGTGGYGNGRMIVNMKEVKRMQQATGKNSPPGKATRGRRLSAEF